MQSTVDTEQACENSRLNLLACLALYQHRKDQAIGIGWMSSLVRGLLWYYNWLQQKQMANIMTIYYLTQTIDQKAEAIKELAIKGKDAKNKGEILQQMMNLEAEIDIAKAMLDDLKKTTA